MPWSALLSATRIRSSYANATLVARAVDADGNIVSEELTTQDNLRQHWKPRQDLNSRRWRRKTMDVEKALEERAKRRFKPRDDDPDSFEDMPSTT